MLRIPQRISLSSRQEKRPATFTRVPQQASSVLSLARTRFCSQKAHRARRIGNVNNITWRKKKPANKGRKVRPCLKEKRSFLKIPRRRRSSTAGEGRKERREPDDDQVPRSRENLCHLGAKRASRKAVDARAPVNRRGAKKVYIEC